MNIPFYEVILYYWEPEKSGVNKCFTQEAAGTLLKTKI